MFTFQFYVLKRKFQHVFVLINVSVSTEFVRLNENKANRLFDVMFDLEMCVRVNDFDSVFNITHTLYETSDVFDIHTVRQP